MLISGQIQPSRDATIAPSCKALPCSPRRINVRATRARSSLVLRSRDGDHRFKDQGTRASQRNRRWGRSAARSIRWESSIQPDCEARLAVAVGTMPPFEQLKSELLDIRRTHAQRRAHVERDHRSAMLAPSRLGLRLRARRHRRSRRAAHARITTPDRRRAARTALGRLLRPGPRRVRIRSRATTVGLDRRHARATAAALDLRRRAAALPSTLDSARIGRRTRGFAIPLADANRPPTLVDATPTRPHLQCGGPREN